VLRLHGVNSEYHTLTLAEFAILEKNERKPWQKKEWCIPPEQDAAFVCQMEDL